MDIKSLLKVFPRDGFYLILYRECLPDSLCIIKCGETLLYVESSDVFSGIEGIEDFEPIDECTMQSLNDLKELNPIFIGLCPCGYDSLNDFMKEYIEYNAELEDDDDDDDDMTDCATCTSCKSSSTSQLTSDLINSKIKQVRAC